MTISGLGPHGERAAPPERVSLLPDDRIAAKAAGWRVAVVLHTLQSDWAKQQLAGITFPVGYSGAVPLECNLVIDGGDIAGRVTSIAFSPSLERYIGLAFLRPDLAASGTTVSIRLTDGAMVQAEVSATPFYDPDNLKQKEAA